MLRWMVYIVIVIVPAKFIIAISVESVAIGVEKTAVRVRVETLSVIHSTIVNIFALPPVLPSLTTSCSCLFKG